mmetsp:Transcript_4526/g.11676  ORF Transcript_4526/g.11676 Transcript_4526/m.11676 type:complete len:490 (+) Transcript_4526:383-1852(+)
MSVEESSVVIETMTSNTKAKQNRRNSFGSSIHNAELENYINQNIMGYGTSGEPVANTRSVESSEMFGYAPSFDGYLDIRFSIHVPCDHTMKDCRLEIDGEQQGRLESLVMLYLCSQGVELVISTAPTSLIQVCPFKNDQSGSSFSAKANAIGSAVLGENGKETTEHLIVWNLPRFQTATFAFDEHPEYSKTVLDMATDTSLYVSKEPLEYFTQLTFTYPVYQWGSEDPSIVEALQDGFDDGVISSGTLNSLLPWPDSIAAPTGDEPYVFWNEPLPGPVPFFDTTLPVDVGTLMHWIGIGLMAANTLCFMLLSLMSYRRQRRLEVWTKQENNRRKYEASSQSGLQTDYLDTEAGISAILMESKHYALAKSGGVDALYQQDGARASGTGDRNISGVEVDLKMVDHPNKLLTHTQSMNRYENRRATKKPRGKEEDLLARARYRSAPAQGVSTAWYSSDHLLNSGDDEDDSYDDELNLAPVQRATGNKEQGEC